MRQLILMAFASLPALLTALGSQGISHEIKPKSTLNASGSCKCSVDAQPGKLPRPTPKNSVPACPPDLDEDCVAQPNPTIEYWCKAGGIWATCENGGDNDGDGTPNEAHFRQKRYIVTYVCATRIYQACGDWMAMKIAAGSSQDQCCAFATAAPPCPSGTCKK